MLQFVQLEGQPDFVLPSALGSGDRAHFGQVQQRGIDVCIVQGAPVLPPR